MERAFDPGSGEPGVANDAGWQASAWDDPVHEQTPKGGLSPVTEYDPGTGVWDSAAFRPLSSCCQGGGALDMSDPTLSVSAIVLSLSTGACWSLPSPCVGGWGLLIASTGDLFIFFYFYFSLYQRNGDRGGNTVCLCALGESK